MFYMVLTCLAVIQINDRINNNMYIYQENINQSYLFKVGDIQCIGTINSKGDFVPDYDQLSRSIRAFKDSTFLPLGSFPKGLTSGMYPDGKVYEYRSGFLVPMIIDLKKGLIPEVGGKIIDFKDYKYSPTARRIYNLPGRFVLKQGEPAKKP